MTLLFLLLQTYLAGAELSHQQMLARVTEEAEMLRQNIRLAVSEETLEQRAVQPPSRFKPRDRKPAARPALHTREIVSEYSVGPIGAGAAEHLVEFRQVVSVDGRKLQSAESARQALSAGIAANEDRARKRMLEDFERHGLLGAVTDFGILLLQFTKRGIGELRIAPFGGAMIGPDPVLVFRYEQTAGAGVTDFTKSKAARYPLKGLLFVRIADGIPLRITVEIHRTADKHVYDDDATVDYVLTSHGFLGPISVVHRAYIDTQLLIENRFRYAPFRRFGAETEIKFTEIPDPPAKAPGKP